MTTRPHHDLSTLLDNYTSFDKFEALHIQQLRTFLEGTDNAYDRSNLLAHVVADAWILSPDFTKVVLVEHKLNNRWMAPGGHCDGDPDVYATALRETEEETGLTGIKPLVSGIFDINCGCVPDRSKGEIFIPRHFHFDVCFAFVATSEQPLKISDESTDLQWVSVADIPQLNFFPEHMRRYEKTLQKWHFSA